MTNSNSVKSVKAWLVVSASLCMLSVLIGAFAAHGLKSVLNTYQLGIVETAAKYQMYHGLAMILTVIVANQFRTLTHLNRVNGAFLIGNLLFSGSLYLLALTGIKLFAYFTPVGGVSFVIAWALFIVMALNIKRQ